ncbi:collagen alpha-1(I) chain-like [Panthera leo]|uniref:collagen alpha-1(I) chain-like n=1 Tax=Panthera leo TaxID=9689 RepID=UPI001C6A0380|nr:collagen alpha-1(I) chain-like [Panthera leo]
MALLTPAAEASCLFQSYMHLLRSWVAGAPNPITPAAKLVGPSAGAPECAAQAGKAGLERQRDPNHAGRQGEAGRCFCTSSRGSVQRQQDTDDPASAAQRLRQETLRKTTARAPLRRRPRLAASGSRGRAPPLEGGGPGSERRLGGGWCEGGVAPSPSQKCTCSPPGVRSLRCWRRFEPSVLPSKQRPTAVRTTRSRSECPSPERRSDPEEVLGPLGFEPILTGLTPPHPPAVPTRGGAQGARGGGVDRLQPRTRQLALLPGGGGGPGAEATPCTSKCGPDRGHLAPPPPGVPRPSRPRPAPPTAVARPRRRPQKSRRAPSPTPPPRSAAGSPPAARRSLPGGKHTPRGPGVGGGGRECPSFPLHHTPLLLPKEPNERAGSRAGTIGRAQDEPDASCVARREGGAHQPIWGVQGLRSQPGGAPGGPGWSSNEHRGSWEQVREIQQDIVQRNRVLSQRATLPADKAVLRSCPRLELCEARDSRTRRGALDWPRPGRVR